jgi:hypothetical protein
MSTGNNAEQIDKQEVKLAISTTSSLEGTLEEEVIDVSTLQASELRSRALAFRGQINQAAIGLAEVLHTIYQREKWRDFGFSSFQEYVETELEVGYRSAMYSVKIISTMREHNISMAQARDLGWGRLRAILPHITTRNVGSLLDMATSRSVREIQTELTESGIVSSGTEATNRITFNCSPSEASTIFDSIDEAKKRLDTDSISSALEYVCQEWSIANEGDVSQTSLADIIAFCERNYGVALAPVGDNQEVADMVGEEN